MTDEQLAKLQKILAQSNIPPEYLYVFSCGLCELAERDDDYLETQYGTRFDQQLQNCTMPDYLKRMNAN